MYIFVLPLKMGEKDSAIAIWNKGYEVDKLSALPYVGKFRVLWLAGDKAAAAEPHGVDRSHHPGTHALGG